MGNENLKNEAKKTKQRRLENIKRYECVDKIKHERSQRSNVVKTQLPK